MKTTITALILLVLASALNAQVGIGTTNPDVSSILDITATDKGVLVPRVSLNNVSNTMIDGTNIAAEGLLIYNTNLTTTGGSGIGFYYFDGTMWVPLQSSSVTISTENGISNIGNTVRLGGALNQNTTINQGLFDLTYNLSNTGDFNIQDNGTTHFQVRDNGNSYFGGEIVVAEDNVTGTRVARLFNIAGQDGALYLYRNNTLQHRIDAGFSTLFNSQGLDIDFIVESDTNPTAFGIDASNDIMYAGNSLSSLTNNGNTINGNTIDYVASFYTRNASNGTAIQLGSTEYIMDSGNLQMSVYGSWLPYYPMGSPAFTLGNAAQRWSSVWAINGTIQTSDERLKTNIKPLPYGLAEILQLQPISYHWKQGFNEGPKLGFSAQELQKIIPEVVVSHSYDLQAEDGTPTLKENKNLGVYYSDIIPVLTNAIQEQQTLIIALEQRINSLENKQ